MLDKTVDALCFLTGGAGVQGQHIQLQLTAGAYPLHVGQRTQLKHCATAEQIALCFVGAVQIPQRIVVTGNGVHQCLICRSKGAEAQRFFVLIDVGCHRLQRAEAVDIRAGVAGAGQQRAVVDQTEGLCLVGDAQYLVALFQREALTSQVGAGHCVRKVQAGPLGNTVGDAEQHRSLLLQVHFGRNRHHTDAGLVKKFVGQLVVDQLQYRMIVEKQDPQGLLPHLVGGGHRFGFRGGIAGLIRHIRGGNSKLHRQFSRGISLRKTIDQKPGAQSKNPGQCKELFHRIPFL